MWAFYRGILRSIPGLLFSATALWLKVIAVFLFFLSLANRPLADRMNLAWHGISPWWSILPIGVLLLWSLLVANYKRFQQLEAEYATKLAARGATSVEGPGPATRGVPVSLVWLEGHLDALGFPTDEIAQLRGRALSDLKHAGIMDEEAGDKFFSDLETRETLRTYYAQHLGRRPQDRPAGAPLVDVNGLCLWGPRVHLATPISRPLVLVDLRDTLRMYREAGAR